MVVRPLVAGRLFVKTGSRRHICLKSQNRLDAFRHAGLVKLHGAEQSPVVGDGQRRHAELHRPFHQIRNPDRTVEETVFGMVMEMDKTAMGLHAVITPILLIFLIANNFFLSPPMAPSRSGSAPAVRASGVSV